MLRPSRSTTDNPQRLSNELKIGARRTWSQMGRKSSIRIILIGTIAVILFIFFQEYYLLSNQVIGVVDTIVVQKGSEDVPSSSTSDVRDVGSEANGELTLEEQSPDTNSSSSKASEDVPSSSTSELNVGNIDVEENTSSPKQNYPTINIKPSIAASKYDPNQCNFRTYPPIRYYNLDTPLHDQPSFLSEAEYIRGKAPFVINPPSELNKSTAQFSGTKKLCHTTSEWETKPETQWPFSDGQNPSIISLSRSSIDRDSISPIVDIYGKNNKNGISNLFLGLLLFGDSQCRWNLTPDELQKGGYSPLQSAPSKRSILSVLDQNLNTLGSSSLYLSLDSSFGTSRKKLQPSSKRGADGENIWERTLVELDDSRFFFHNGKPHVLFRNGPLFGYEVQVQNRIHFEKVNDHTFVSYIKASESFVVCCGRNISFISELPKSVNQDGTMNRLHDSGLSALSWIDPLTIEEVDKSILNKSDGNNRRLQSTYVRHGRKLQDDKSKSSSNIHGTNGFMIPLHSSSELLGIAHFHRPEGRSQSPYARHGHHYTHAFFTILLQPSSSLLDSDNNQKLTYKLNRLSNEFIFSSPSSSTAAADSTGDVIQFASGLDIIDSNSDLDVDVNGQLLISYGINDCEGAVLSLEMKVVQEMLVKVEDGLEVRHLMKLLDNKEGNS